MIIKIFVEGPTDKEFLEQYLKFLKFSKESFSIVSCNGNSCKTVRSKMREAYDNENKVILIFDADKNFKSTLEKLKQESCYENKYLLSDENIFLFPNHSESGELETLLFKIAKFPKINECFEKYQACLGCVNKNYPKNIDKKSARFAYFEALGLSLPNKKKDKTDKEQETKDERQDTYEKIFNFSSPKLEPLKKFLKKAFDGIPPPNP